MLFYSSCSWLLLQVSLRWGKERGVEDGRQSPFNMTWLLYLGSPALVMVEVQGLALSWETLLWLLWCSLCRELDTTSSLFCACLLISPAPFCGLPTEPLCAGIPWPWKVATLGSVFLLASCSFLFLSVNLVRGNLAWSHQFMLSSPSYYVCSGQQPVFISPNEVRHQDLCPQILEDKGSYFRIGLTYELLVFQQECCQRFCPSGEHLFNLSE